MNDYLNVQLKNKFLIVGVYLAFFIELGMITFWYDENLFNTNNLISQYNIENYIRPLIYSLASLIICVLPLFIKKEDYPDVMNSKNGIDFKEKLIVVIIISISGAFITWVMMYRVIHKFEPLIQHSDIIPVIDVFATRFANGDKIYKEFTEIGYNVIATYLPAQWLPFVFPKIIDFDYRWMAFIVLILSFLYYQYRLVKQNLNFVELLIKASLPFIVLFFLIKYMQPEMGWTIENLIAGYYIILGLSIFSTSNLIRASALILCLLSRYSLLFWVPMYILFIFLFDNKKDAIKISLYTFIGILFIFIIPYLSKNWGLISYTQKMYTEAAIGEWDGQSWQAPNAKPIQLFKGFGFACYFYDFIDGSLLKRINILKASHLVLSILSVIIAGFIYRKFKRRIDYRLYCLLALKFYFIFFYGFIQVPYSYLYMVPAFISVVVLMKLPELLTFNNSLSIKTSDKKSLVSS